MHVKISERELKRKIITISKIEVSIIMIIL